MGLVPARFLAQKTIGLTGVSMMLLRAVASLAAVLIGSIGAGEMAWAQYYPPYSPQPQYSVPPYRAVPPPEWDDDDGPVGSLPGGYDRPAPLRPPLPTGRAPYEPYGAVTGSVPYGTREMPGTVERDPYGLPPPGVDPDHGDLAGRVCQRFELEFPRIGAPMIACRLTQLTDDRGTVVTPGQPEYGYGPPTIRPPADVGSGQQQQTIAALPPEVQPESGEIKELPPQLRRQIVDYQTREPAGTITIDTANTYLYLVLGNGKAMRYGIGVGREGFTWSGTQRIARMAEWPDWIPPQEMIERQPYLPRFMAGGPGNPLGARAFYPLAVNLRQRDAEWIIDPRGAAGQHVDEFLRLGRCRAKAER